MKNNSRDSYEEFLAHFGIEKERFFRFGLDETIFAPFDKVKQNWEDLKDRISNNQQVVIRKYGRNPQNTELLIKMYRSIYHNGNIDIDRTGNQIPQKIVENLTGYKRNRDLFNYQVAHIFGRTKNIYMFECPWNIILIPKIFDPLTGHEAQGVFRNEFRAALIKRAYTNFKKFIDEYNQEISCILLEKSRQYLQTVRTENPDFPGIDQFEKDLEKELGPIDISGKIEDVDIEDSDSSPETQPKDPPDQQISIQAPVGILVRAFFRNASIKNRLSEELIHQLTDLDCCKSVLKLQFSCLKKISGSEPTIDERYVSGHARYYAKPYKINGRYYVLTNHWFDSNQPLFIQWVIEHNLLDLLPDGSIKS